jgi:hypothetical protein
MSYRGFRVGYNTSGTYAGSVSEKEFMDEFRSWNNNYYQGYNGQPYTMDNSTNGAAAYWGTGGITSLWDANNNSLGKPQYGTDVSGVHYATPWSAFKNAGAIAYYDIVVVNSTNNTSGQSSWINAYYLDSTSAKFFQSGSGIATNGDGGSFPEWQAGDLVYGYNNFGYDNYGGWTMMGSRTNSGQTTPTNYANGNGYTFGLRSFLVNSTRGQWALRMNSNQNPVTQASGPFSLFLYNNSSDWTYVNSNPGNSYQQNYCAIITDITSSATVSSTNNAYFGYQNFSGEQTGLWWGPYGVTPSGLPSSTLGAGFRLGIN